MNIYTCQVFQLLKTTRKTKSEHCKTLTQKVKNVACKPSTVCTYQTQNAGGRAMERRGSECNKRTHTHTSVYSHPYQTHIHHTNTTYQNKSNLF